MSDPEQRRKLQLIIGGLRIGLSNAKRSRAQENLYMQARSAAQGMGCGAYGDSAKDLMTRVRAKLEGLNDQG